MKNEREREQAQTCDSGPPWMSMITGNGATPYLAPHKRMRINTHPTEFPKTTHNPNAHAADGSKRQAQPSRQTTRSERAPVVPARSSADHPFRCRSTA
jgi:hypothetical protein